MKEGFLTRNDFHSIFFSDLAERGNEDIKTLFLRHLEYSMVKDITNVQPWDIYFALSYWKIISQYPYQSR